LDLTMGFPRLLAKEGDTQGNKGQTTLTTLLRGLRTIWMPTEGLRLMASLRPLGGTPAPTLSRRFQVRGANGDRY
jgi:hypothetical protein